MSLPSDLASGSHFLIPQKSPSRQTLSPRRSKSSLLADGAARGTSLAHELAAALMPEPSAGSRLLADEFGIEFDEGAEGIDEVSEPRESPPVVVVIDERENTLPQLSDWAPGDALPDSKPLRSGSELRQTLHDPLVILNRDLGTTDLFIENLRRMDTDPSSTSTHLGSSVFEPPLERLASDVIRRINDSAREREGQVRELREFDKEFRRIAGEAGGNELLGELDALAEVEGFRDELKEKEAKLESGPGGLHAVEEEDEPIGRRDTNTDWELDPNRVLGDEDTMEYGDLDRPDSPFPAKDSSSLPPPPPIPGIPTPASTITQLAYMRSITQSLIQSLSTVVEHTQVTGAATAEAGRKIRALKNKLGGWRAESESAERSIEKIEKWEAGGGMSTPLFDGSLSIASANGFGHGKGLTMKEIMQEELDAFEHVLAEAGRKTLSIMAAS